MVDLRLIGGAALFGLGWGLAGLCPGPAIAGLVYRRQQSIIFILAMIFGTLIARATSRRPPIRKEFATEES